MTNFSSLFAKRTTLIEHQLRALPLLFQPQALLMDLDGTLLNQHKEFSSFTTQVLGAHLQEGASLPLVISTGRHYATVKKLIEPIFSRLRPKQAHIMCGGATLIRANGEILWERKLASALVEELCRRTTELGGGFIFGQGETMYGDQSKTVEQHQRFNQNAHYDLATDLTDWSTPLLIINHLNPAVDDLIATFAADICAKRMVGKDDLPYYDLTLKGINKASAMQLWAANADLDIKQLAAVGDNDNDLEMLQTVGLGLAVANAIPEVQAAAKMVLALNNQQDAVAHLITVFDKINFSELSTKIC